ncbi:MAG: pre-peptidase C-terminal domain-containing protein, partial [Bacillota bacterium]
TPFVSGTIALMLDANPGLTVQQVKDLLQQSAQEWGPPGQDVDYGWGRLDSYRAVARAGGFSEAGAPAVPGHLTFTGSLSSGESAEHSLEISELSYPVNITLLMPGSGTNPDFDLYLYDPAGHEVGKSVGTTRQDQVRASVSQTGTYRVRVRSYSGSGSYVVDVSAGLSDSPVDEPPSVAVASPAEGATVGGTVGVQVAALDDQAVSRVEVAIDGGAWQDVTGSYDGAHYIYSWDTAGVPDGDHLIRARATDSAGQQAEAQRSVRVENAAPPGQYQWSRTGSVSSSSRDAEYTLNVAQPGYVDFTLAWGTAADLDLYVYAPDGSLAGRAFTLRNPERLRIDTVRWGTGAYRVRVNHYSGVASGFTLTAAGYQRLTFSGAVSSSSPNSLHAHLYQEVGPSRVVLTWPGSSDLDFYVYDPSGRERTRAFTLQNPEVREFTADLTGEWTVRVNLYGGAATGYTLYWFTPAPLLS